MEGVYDNAAAPAVREPFSLRWFDYDISLGVSFPGAYGNTDFSNRGENGDPRLTQRTDNFLYYNLGLQLQFGQLGVTVMGDFLSYDIESPSATTSGLSLTLGRIHAVGAYGIANNQVVIGAGARIILADVSAKGTNAFGEFTQRVSGGGAILQMAGAAPEAGIVIKPNERHWRAGATIRAPVEGGNISTDKTTVDPVTGVTHAGAFIVPDRIVQPWELEAGIAWQFGPRPLNPPWIDPDKDEQELVKRIVRDRADRAAAQQAELGNMPGVTVDDIAARADRAEAFARDERLVRATEDMALSDAKERLYEERKARYLNWPRERVLLLASMLITGASPTAVSVEGFIDQRRELVGQSVTLAPRLAAESEPVPNLLRTRAGIYFEPSRFSDGTTRQHFTFGTDIRLLSWDVFGILSPTTWRLTAFVDLAPRYQNFGFSIGAWR